jgi:hypothetical protein
VQIPSAADFILGVAGCHQLPTGEAALGPARIASNRSTSSMITSMKPLPLLNREDNRRAYPVILEAWMNTYPSTPPAMVKAIAL